MEKDIRFTGKKVDDSWKEQVAREKGTPTPAEARANARSSVETAPVFMNFLTSLGYQAMLHLGEMPHPETQKREIQLEAVREIIELLVALKDKTHGQTSPEESRFFSSVLPELQLKFAQKV